MIREILLAAALALAPRGGGLLDQVSPAAAQAGDEVDGLRASARAEEKARRFPDAIRAWERVLAAHPDDPAAKRSLARLAAWTGDLDRAVVLYREARARAPRDVGLQSDLADVLSWAQRWDEAQPLYEEALRREPGHHEALKGLARLLLARRDIRAASPLIARAFALFPSDPDLHKARARLLALEGDLSGAAEASRRAAALAPTDPEAARMLGEVLFRANDFSGAADAYRRAMALEPESPRNQVMLARTQLALGRIDSAREHAQAALSLNPLDPEAVDLDRALRREAAAAPFRSAGDAIELLVFVALLPVVLVVPYRMRRALARKPGLRAFAWYVVPAFVSLNIVLHLAKTPLERFVDHRIFEAGAEVMLFLGLGVGFLAAVRNDRVVGEFAGMVALAIGAHPDDVELGAAGFLMKLKDSGARVYALTMTRGELGGEPDRRPRESEQAAAFMRLDGAKVLDFPDTRLGEHVPAMRAAIEREIRALGATVVLTHTDVDVHGDHRAVHSASREAARAVPTVLCYEDVSTSKEFVPNYFVDISSYMGDHLKAISFHRSQVKRKYMDPEVVRGRAAHRGLQIGTSFAMAFRTLNIVR